MPSHTRTETYDKYNAVQKFSMLCLVAFLPVCNSASADDNIRYLVLSIFGGWSIIQDCFIM